MKHEKLPKEQAPRKGGRYTVYREGQPLFDADIIKYGGGCWATVQVVAVDERVAEMYRPGDVFDTRVGMYEFRQADDTPATDTSTGGDRG